jgi:hypothetical protein
MTATLDLTKGLAFKQFVNLANHKITWKVAEHLLLQSVADRGADYLYPKDSDGSCNYVRDGAASCLVGQALYHAGLPIDRLAEFDEGGLTPANEFSKELLRDGYTLTQRAAKLFQLAQELQDDGVPWGEAVARAIENT